VTAPPPGYALGRFLLDGRPVTGLVVGGRMLPLGPRLLGGAAPDPSGPTGTAGPTCTAGQTCTAGPTGTVSINDLLSDWDSALPRLAELAATELATTGLAATEPSGWAEQWLPVAQLTVLPPVEPRQIFQAGANYRTHVIDLAVKHAEIREGMTPEQIRAEVAATMDRRAAEGLPYLFLGLPSAVTGPYDDVTLPDGSDQHDWELELAAVIGREAHRVEPERALDHVAGYTVVNDLTTRDLVFRRDIPEIGTDWFRAKNAPGFLPTGPYLVPSELVGDPQQLRITLRLNGQVMQDESCKDMLFGVAALVAAASRTARLLPGDLVLTGSPAGNGLHHGRLLRPGDVMEGTITGPGVDLGTQQTRCVAPVPGSGAGR
jgi:2-keto-4-pentenoate hydratase/2-oxohepta-3-ene-1,7-dioic acid hydratase in catechol pathway